MATTLPPFGELRPELLEEWVRDKNPYDPANVSGGSTVVAFWRCKTCAHEWKARVSNRCRLRQGCPRCAGQQIDASQSIAVLHPEIMEYWHSTLNSHLDPFAISPGSKERAWWKCKVCDYEWDSYIFNKAKKGVGCPRCSGQFASEHNCLENLYPEIAAELHQTKNGQLTSRTLTGKSGQKVWWNCPTCLNEYEAKVVNRTHRGSGCPLCAGDNVGRQTAERIASEESDSFLDYSYDADTQILEQHREIQAAFRSYLNIEPDPRSIDSLLSPRVKSRINYSPYYQRNYVWDTTKASYFIESILLGTEIPPLIFFDVNQAFEVIDGRQRFETILRFVDGKFALNRAGLHALKSLADKTFSELPLELQSAFLDTAIRIVKFRLVDAQRCNELIQDLIKKEVFRRYNSGITPLRRIDVNRAVYIKDSITDHFKKQLKRNKTVFAAIVRCFLADSDRDKVEHPDTLEKACQVIRDLLISAEISVISARKRQTADQVYERFSDQANDAGDVFKDFTNRLKTLLSVESFFSEDGTVSARQWWYALFWGISVLQKEGKPFIQLDEDSMKMRLLEYYKGNKVLFVNEEAAFFYQQYVERYRSVATILGEIFDCSFEVYINARGREDHAEQDTNDDLLLRLERQDPITRSVDDITRMLVRRKFILRPVYQRNEVINKAKSSAIIESILLGIKLPPLFIFERIDGAQEVVDGQQRLLSILGYLSVPFKDENGNELRSTKDGFALSDLRILDELKQKTFGELSDDLKNKIWEFPLTLIVIKEQSNPGFEPVDLYIRLNSRPLPIKEHSFEMWNSYVPKQLVDEVKSVTRRHQGWFYLTNPKNDSRMNNEELITTLAYMDYSWRRCVSQQAASTDFIDLFRRQTTVGVRIKQKSDITNLLNFASGDEDVLKNVCESIRNVDKYIRRLRTILLDTDENAQIDTWLEKEFSNWLGRKTYARKRQDHYSLWYLSHALTNEMVIKHRVAMKSEIRTLLELMKSADPSEELEQSLSTFRSLVDEFRDTYAIDARKIRLTTEEKQALIRSQGNLCPICSNKLFIHDELAVDHRIPLAKGGKDERDNLRVTHYFCNLKRGSGGRNVTET